MGLSLFQSAPVITDGRSLLGRWVALVAAEFQSAPVITDGRSLDGVLITPYKPVSIRARHH